MMSMVVMMMSMVTMRRMNIISNNYNNIIVVVLILQVPGNSDTPGPAYCPRIENIIANSSEILIPSGSELALRVRVIQYQVGGMVESPLLYYTLILFSVISVNNTIVLM